MTDEKLIKLIILYCQKEIKTADFEELKSWIYESDDNRKAFKKHFSNYKESRKIGFKNKISNNEAWDNIFSQIDSKKTKTGFIGRRFMYAAASVAIVVSLGILAIMNDTDSLFHHKQEVAQILPGGTKATLTLSDGSTVDLGDTKPQKLSEHNGAEINIDSTNKIVYSGNDSKSNKIIYNTIKVPRAGEYILKLSDGTKVWLNSESEIKYPVAFKGNTRQVSIKGEVFFKVAKDKTKPFIVNCYSTKIKVLGTEFNVNAYNNGENIYTTLVEGSVSVGKDKAVIIKPGQQAVTQWHTQKVNIREVDVNLYTSWVNGQFEYEGMKLEYIAEQLKRWYDVDFIFEDEDLKDKKFTGVISRHKPLNFILELMEQLSNVKYTIKNSKKVVIHKK